MNKTSVLPLMLALTMGGCNASRTHGTANTIEAPSIAAHPPQSSTPALDTSTAPPKTAAAVVASGADTSMGPQKATPGQAADTGIAAGEHRWSFDADAVNAPPPRFSFGRTGKGREGRWNVRADPGAPSGGQVLAQLDADDNDYRFPVAVANEPLLRDGSVSVRCKSVSGSVDQACGLVFRYRDPDNYYVTRANALENNVRLYHVKNGNRQQFAGWNGTVSTGKWHSLRIDIRGDHFEVYWEDKKVIDAHDSTFRDAGKIGVWTKADSVTYFDDLLVKVWS